MVSLVFGCTPGATAYNGVLSSTGLKGMLLWIYKATPPCGVLLKCPFLLITVKLGIVTFVLFHNFVSWSAPIFVLHRLIISVSSSFSLLIHQIFHWKMLALFMVMPCFGILRCYILLCSVYRIAAGSFVLWFVWSFTISPPSRYALLSFVFLLLLVSLDLLQFSSYMWRSLSTSF